MLLLQINNNIRHSDEVSWNHVSMCILNGGGIRSPIDERNNGMLPRLRVSAQVSLQRCPCVDSAHLSCQPRTTMSVSSVSVNCYSSQCLSRRAHTCLCVLIRILTQSRELGWMEPNLDLNCWHTKPNTNYCWLPTASSLIPRKRKGQIAHVCAGKKKNTLLD